MNRQPLVSIIINNYNYDRFLSDSIESVLNQTYNRIEVIVVDDGSSDGSHDILNNYSQQIIAIFKTNGGQASAINEGVKVSNGEIVCFLDADDLFEPNKVEKIVEFFINNLSLGKPIILHNLFTTIDKDSKCISTNLIANILGFTPLESTALAKFITGYNAATFFNGEINLVSHPDRVYEFVRRYRFLTYLGMPTSSISMSRAMVDLLFPLPVDGLKISADELIVKAGALMGEVYSTNLPLTQYRLHGNNNWYGRAISREQEELASIQGNKYFNNKLQAVGKQPVFCFLKSIPAAGFYRRYLGSAAGGELIDLAIDVVRWHLDSITFSFFIETFTRGMYYQIMQCIHTLFHPKQDSLG